MAKLVGNEEIQMSTDHPEDTNHGDSIAAPGTASDGCVIMPRFARERVWESQDRRLAVVPSLPAWPNE